MFQTTNQNITRLYLSDFWNRIYILSSLGVFCFRGTSYYRYHGIKSRGYISLSMWYKSMVYWTWFLFEVSPHGFFLVLRRHSRFSLTPHGDFTQLHDRWFSSSGSRTQRPFRNSTGEPLANATNAAVNVYGEISVTEPKKKRGRQRSPLCKNPSVVTKTVRELEAMAQSKWHDFSRSKWWIFP